MKTLLLLMVTALILPGTAIHAETIKVPVGTQSPELSKIPRPNMGMSKAAVKSQFGAPAKETSPKGKPPISNWEYADFIVYFENDHVIHSVLKEKYHEGEEIILEETVEMPEENLKIK